MRFRAVPEMRRSHSVITRETRRPYVRHPRARRSVRGNGDPSPVRHLLPDPVAARPPPVPVAPSATPKGNAVTRTRNLARLVPAAAAILALSLAGCGARTASGTSTTAAAAGSCVDTSGDTVKLGFLNSLSGTMAISEQTVRDSLILAAEEINADGGIWASRSRSSRRTAPREPTVFAEKIKKLLTAGLGRRRVRRLDLGHPQGDAAGLRGQQRRCCSTRCSTRASRRRRTSTTPARRPTSRSSRPWTS